VQTSEEEDKTKKRAQAQAVRQFRAAPPYSNDVSAACKVW
jgi:hypothetical protein